MADLKGLQSGTTMSIIQSFSLVCLLNVIVGSTAFAVQSEQVVSEKAAALLTQVIQHYEEFDKTKVNERREIRGSLFRLLIPNGQFEEAKRLANDCNQWKRNEILGRIASSRLQNAIREDGRVNADQMKLFKQLTGGKGVSVPLADNLKLLMENERFEEAEELVDAMDGDLETYVHQSGNYGNAYDKLNSLRVIAEYHLRNGNGRRADRLFKKVGEQVTRDQMHYQIMSSCLYARDRIDASVAESMFKRIKSGEKRYWSAYKLGTHFAREKNLAKAIDYVEMMDKHLEESTVQSRSYQTNLLLSIVVLADQQGKDPLHWLDRAKAFYKSYGGKTGDLICVETMFEDSETGEATPFKVLQAASRLFYVDSDYFTDIDSPLVLIDKSDRMEIARKLPDFVDNPLMKARVLVDLARNLSKSNIEEAITLTDAAFDAAQEEEKPFVVSKDYSINQNDVFQDVAVTYARLGELESALKVVGMISDEPNPNLFSSLRMLSYREKALEVTMRELRREDNFFGKERTEQAFEAIEQLKSLDPRIARVALNSILGKLVEHGQWEDAEQVFLKAKNEWKTSVGVPYAVLPKIRATNSYERLNHWYGLCEDEDKQKFISMICGFDANNRLPSSRMIIEIEKLLEDAWGDEPLSPDIQRFLIVGLWADGFEERAKQLIADLNNDRQGSYYLLRLVVAARECDLPELACYVAAQYPSSQHLSALLNSSFKPSTRFNKLVDDEQWIARQPAMMQISMKLSRAKHLLDEAIEKVNKGRASNENK